MANPSRFSPYLGSSRHMGLSTMSWSRIKLLGCLMLATNPSFSDAFSSYLLSRTGCFVDLSTDEVIMNNAVTAADQSLIPMNIHINGAAVQSSSFSVDSFPAKLSLQVILANPNDNVGDYQFAIDTTPPQAFFEAGGCEDNKRIAGRGDETVELTVKEAGAKVWAGWASSQESVKLTPVVTILGPSQPQDSKEHESQDAMSQKSQDETDWVSLLMNNCDLNHVLDTDLKTLDDRPIVTSKSRLVGRVEGNLPAQLILNWDKEGNEDAVYETVVLESSEGAVFEQGVCNGQRISLKTEWPPLTVLQDRDITVWGLYSVSGKDEIRRTEPFVLKWTPKDPQKEVEEKIRQQMDLKEQIQQHHERKGKSNKDPKIKKRENDSRKASKSRGHSRSKSGLTRPERRRRRPERKSVVEHNLEEVHAQIAGITTPPSPKQHFLLRGHAETVLTFRVGPNYFAGLVILLLCPFIAIQCFLHASNSPRRRKSKGRLKL